MRGTLTLTQTQALRVSKAFIEIHWRAAVENRTVTVQKSEILRL